MLDLTALRIAIRVRLVGDATLGTLLETVGGEPGVFNLRIPSAVTWSKPVLELGWQADVEDEANAYTQRGQDLRLRLMAHDRGDAPGIGNLDDATAALVRADTVLLATPLTVSGQTVWEFHRTGGIPETSQVDDDGYLWLSTGSLYRVRSV